MPGVRFSLVPILVLSLAIASSTGAQTAGSPARSDSLSFDEFRGATTVLVFYRSGDCGLCRERLRALDEHLDDYDDLGVKVVVLTADPPDGIERVRDELGLDLRIEHADRAMLARWGVWPEGADAPFPAAFVLDEAGQVRFRHVGESAADRVSDEVLLAAVRRAR